MDRANKGCGLFVCLFLGACCVLLWRDETAHERRAAAARAAIRPGMTLAEALAAAGAQGRVRLEAEPFDGDELEVYVRDPGAIAKLTGEVAAPTSATGWTLRVPFHQQRVDSTGVAWLVVHLDRAGKVTTVEAGGAPAAPVDAPTPWAERHASHLGGLLSARREAWGPAIGARLAACGARGGHLTAGEAWPKGAVVEVRLELRFASHAPDALWVTWRARPGGDLRIVDATFRTTLRDQSQNTWAPSEAQHAELAAALRDVVWADVLESSRGLEAPEAR